MGGHSSQSLRRHGAFLPILAGAFVLAATPNVFAMKTAPGMTIEGAGARAVHATATLRGRPAPTLGRKKVFLESGVLRKPTTAVSPPPAPADPAPVAAVGHDISYPQCDTGLPAGGAFMIVGLNGGRPFTTNPCFGGQFTQTSPRPHAVYVNASHPDDIGPFMSSYCNSTAPAGLDGGANYAWRIGCSEAQYDLIAFLSLVHGTQLPSEWWLDVEVMNSWTDNQAANRWVVRGMVDRLQRDHLKVGVYSASLMWAELMGSDWDPGVPQWVAGPIDRDQAAGACGAPFGGHGIVHMVQFPSNGFDANLICDR